MDEKKTAVQVQPEDNVASVFAAVIAGDSVQVMARDGSVNAITALQDIPYGHKIALTDIPRGSTVLKYGQSIGLTSADIAAGEHVHVHNLESARGRGDWEE